MKKTIILLTVILVAQVGLTVALNMNRQQLAPFEPTANLLPFDRAAVDTITITGGKGEKVRLVKEKGKWILPDYYRFPADQDAVNKMLDTLAGMKEGWPVATTSGAAERFKVARTDFERHIVLAVGSRPVADLYVGTSPGFRKVHVRVAGSPDILAVKFSAYDAGTGPDDWLDRRYLALDREKIRSIALPGFTLVRKENRFVLADLADDEQMKKEAVDSLVSRVAGLTIEAVLGDRDKPEYLQKEPKLTLTVELPDKKRVCTFSKPGKEDWYVLKTSDSDLYFKVAAWQLTPLLDAKRSLLVEKKKAEEKEAAEAKKNTGSPERKPQSADNTTKEHGNDAGAGK